MYFNPRPREEGDDWSGVTPLLDMHFNPRPREEGDLAAFASPFFSDISIHALVKRATLLTACTGFFIAFQSTPS